MKIAIAVDGSARDAAVLAWTAQFARPGDDLHVVHAYQELSLSGSVWLPAIRAGDRRRHDARRVVTSAQSVLFVALGQDPQIAVGGSTVDGRPHEVLGDLSAIADLLVVGVHTAPGLSCEVDAECPVAVVPTQWSGTRSREVGVLTGASLSTEAMDRAADFALRSGLTVLVVRTEPGTQPPPDLAGLELVVVDAADDTTRSAVRVALDDLAIPVVLVSRTTTDVSRPALAEQIGAR